MVYDLWKQTLSVPKLWLCAWQCYLACLLMGRFLAQADERENVSRYSLSKKQKYMLFLIPLVKTRLFTRYTMLCMIYLHVGMLVQLALFAVGQMGVNIDVDLYVVIWLSMVFVIIAGGAISLINATIKNATRPKTKLIINVLLEMLKPYGFEYHGTYGYYGWRLYKVLENGVEQTIYLLKDHHFSGFGAALELVLCTSVRPQRVYLEDLDKDDPRCKIRYREYQSNDEFVAVIREYGELMIQYGLKKFEEISVPEFLFEPTKEMHNELYHNHQALAEGFMRKYGISKEVAAYGSLDVVINILKENDERNGDKRFDSDQRKLLLGAVAYYSEELVRELDGRWCNDKGICAIRKFRRLKRGMSTAYNVLGAFCCSWEKDTYSILESNHQEIFARKNT